MYFSSEEYTNPDVVVIFGNDFEMMYNGRCEGNLIHSEISYPNMIHNRETVLVLTDYSKDHVKNGVLKVNAVEPVVQLVPIQENPLRGYGTQRERGSNSAVINDKNYFTCLKRK